MESCELILVKFVVVIGIISVEKTFGPLGAVTDLSLSVDLLTVEFIEFSDGKSVVFVSIIKSEQVLSVVFVSICIEEVIYLFELSLIDVVVLIEIIDCKLIESRYSAFLNFLCSTLSAVELDELFDCHLVLIGQTVLLVQFVNSLLSIWAVENIYKLKLSL